MALSGNGKILLTGDGSGWLKLWLADTMDCVGEQKVHEGRITHIAINHDGRVAASIGNGVLKTFRPFGKKMHL